MKKGFILMRKKALLNGHCRDRQVSIDYDDENGDDFKILGGRLV